MLCCGFTLMMTRPAKCEVKKNKKNQRFWVVDCDTNA